MVINQDGFLATLEDGHESIHQLDEWMEVDMGMKTKDSRYFRGLNRKLNCLF